VIGDSTAATLWRHSRTVAMKKGQSRPWQCLNRRPECCLGCADWYCSASELGRASGKQNSRWMFDRYRFHSVERITRSRYGADGWLRASMSQFTRPAPFSVEPRLDVALVLVLALRRTRRKATEGKRWLRQCQVRRSADAFEPSPCHSEGEGRMRARLTFAVQRSSTLR
jgi:hypothetical protein